MPMLWMDEAQYHLPKGPGQHGPPERGSYNNKQTRL